MSTVPWNEYKTHWMTKDEINFLKGLGTWGVRPRDHQTLLKKYRASISQRKNWGTIIVGAVMEYLNENLSS